MYVRFKNAFMQGVGKYNGVVIFTREDNEYTIDYVKKAQILPKQSPITLGQAITMKQSVIHELLDEKRWKEAGKLGSTDVLLWVQQFGYHVEITENDYEIISAPNSLAA